MRLFPRWHTPEAVARQLIEGLEAGTLSLDPSPTDAQPAEPFAPKVLPSVGEWGGDLPVRASRAPES
jgi:hypothetical protein